MLLRKTISVGLLGLAFVFGLSLISVASGNRWLCSAFT